MSKMKLVSSDLNGTLVKQHTMSDMIRLYIGDQQYRQASDIFERQTSGAASMEEAFQTAGPLTKGLSLREALEYTRTHMEYLDGFHEFIDALTKHNIPLIINSTGYSVTIYAIQAQIGFGKIHGHIGNFLRFGINADQRETLREDELIAKVREYFANPEAAKETIYDLIQATGIIDLGIADEEAKAQLIQEYAARNFGLGLSEVAHIGDTMGDCGGIMGIARGGGVGIAFNYNSALRQYLNRVLRDESIAGRIYFVDPKSGSSNLVHVLPLLMTEKAS